MPDDLTIPLVARRAIVFLQWETPFNGAPGRRAILALAISST